MINLYDKNCNKMNDFNNNGIGSLKDVIKCEVTEELNGEYTVEFEYPKNCKYSDYIDNDNIIKCNVGKNNRQLFRIKNTKQDLTTIKATPQHITYDLIDNALDDVYPQNLRGDIFLEWILQRTQYKHNFTSFSNITSKGTARYVRKNPIEAIIGDIDNSFANILGGELERDNFILKMLKQRGVDEGYTIKYGKNLTGLEFTKDDSNIITRLRPIGFNGLLLPEKYIDSPLINEYPHPRIGEIKYDDIKVKENPNDEEGFATEAEAFAEMRKRANAEFSENEIDKPVINIKIDFVELKKTTKYKNYIYLQDINLGDTVTIILENMKVKARVIKTVYDSLLNKFIKLELGKFKANYITNTSKKILETAKEETKNISATILEQAQISATESLINAMGGNIYKTRQELFIMDTDNPNTCKKVWRYNINGWGYSKNGINGPYEIAATMDGSLVANMIKTGVLSADRIRGGTLTLGGNNNYSGVFSLQNELAEELIRMDNRGIILSNGAKLIGGNGVLSNFQFGKFEWTRVGYSTNYLETGQGEYLYINIPVFIPSNFSIVEAYITIYHSPIKWYYGSTNVWGYCRNIKAYKREDSNNYSETVNLSSELFPENDLFDIEIANAFGTYGFTPSVANDSKHISEQKTSINIKNYLTVNKNTVIQLRTANGIPSLNPNIGQIYQKNYLEQTGNLKAVINVIGYMQ